MSCRVKSCWCNRSQSLTLGPTLPLPESYLWAIQELSSSRSFVDNETPARSDFLSLPLVNGAVCCAANILTRRRPCRAMLQREQNGTVQRIPACAHLAAATVQRTKLF